MSIFVTLLHMPIVNYYYDQKKASVIKTSFVWLSMTLNIKYKIHLFYKKKEQMEKKGITSKELLVLSAFLIVFSIPSCDVDNDDQQWSAEVDTILADYITSSSATFNADILGDISSLEEMGFCYSKAPLPTIQDSKLTVPVTIGLFNASAEALDPGTMYYVRAYYIEGNLVYYSDEVSFTTTVPVSDINDNTYETVQVGDQVWLRSNLAVKNYRNGDPIEDGSLLGNYLELEEPKYFFYFNDEPDNESDYGLLYTWFTITDDRNICPEGFRVPDIMDWENLIIHLDPLAYRSDNLPVNSLELSAVAGGMMKTTGNVEDNTGLWYKPNGDASNVSRLSFLPNGLRDPSGTFDGLGYNSPHWSFTEYDQGSAIMYYTHFFNGGVYTNNFSKKSGYAVRCIKD